MTAAPKHDATDTPDDLSDLARTVGDRLESTGACRLPGVPDDHYHDGPGTSSSEVKVPLGFCPDVDGVGAAAYLRWLDAQQTGALDDDSHALDFGRAYHCRVLEPERWADDYDIPPAPELDYYRHRDTAQLLAKGCAIAEIADEVGVKAGTVKGYAKRPDVQRAAEYWREHPPESTPSLSADDYDLIDHMADALYDHPLGWGELVEAGETEVSYWWAEEIAGESVWCKCRPDLVIRRHDGLHVYDPKTTRDASPGAFGKSAWRYGYHVSAAFYARGLEAVTGETVASFTLVAVDKQRPAMVGVYGLTPEQLRRGEELWRQGLRTIALVREHHYRLCREGYGPAPQTLAMPGWGERAEDRIIEACGRVREPAPF